MFVPCESSPAHSLPRLWIQSVDSTTYHSQIINFYSNYLISCVLAVKCDVPVHVSYQYIQGNVVLLVITYHFLSMYVNTQIQSQKMKNYHLSNVIISPVPRVEDTKSIPWW